MTTVQAGHIIVPDFKTEAMKYDKRPYVVLGESGTGSMLCAAMTTQQCQHSIKVVRDTFNGLSADSYIKCHQYRTFSNTDVHKTLGYINDFNITRQAQHAVGALVEKALFNKTPEAPTFPDQGKMSDHIDGVEDGLGSSSLNIQPVAETPPPKAKANTTPKVEVANDGPPPKARNRKPKRRQYEYSPTSPIGKGIKQIANKDRDWVTVPIKDAKKIESMRVFCYQVAKQLDVEVTTYRAEGNQLVVMRKEGT